MTRLGASFAGLHCDQLALLDIKLAALCYLPLVMVVCAQAASLGRRFFLEGKDIGHRCISFPDRCMGR